MPDSCDTFVVLPSSTKDGGVIFGKNSDRPKNEVQEVITIPAASYQSSDTLQCTYITIPQVSHTYATILSKPSWMWGAEMGSNECGVVVGNEAVFTKLADESDKEEKLLGMDLVRLAIERGSSAEEALNVITGLLQQYGQGGRCYEDPDRARVIYHNSFIIADGKEAWVLETAGKHWAAEKITSGVRNISNLLSIGTRIDAMSEGLKEFATEKGWWNPDDGGFDFSKAFSADAPIGNYTGNEAPSNRFVKGGEQLQRLAGDRIH